jgi:hypothetical protein
MGNTGLAIMALTIISLINPNVIWAQDQKKPAPMGSMGHSMDHSKGHSLPMDHSAHGKSPAVKLHPAEGALVTILSPKNGQTIKGDEVPLIFKLTKGKRGDHIHAYVDGELMGMFKGEYGTLTGIQPGRHVLEVRVVADDHQTELDATATIHFMVESERHAG